MICGVIFDVQRFCLHDGDGIRTTVFLKGCPLHCKWCHNPESQSIRQELMFYNSKCRNCGKCLNLCDSRCVVDNKILIDRETCKTCGKCVEACNFTANKICGYYATAHETIEIVLKDKIFYVGSNGGMTISGGEPSMQPEFSLELLELARQNSINTAIETCGYGRRDFFENANELEATFLFDIKTLDSDNHKKITGVSNETIISNLEYLFSNNADIIIRLPMIPGINDSDKEICALAEFLNEHRLNIRYAKIMPYHSLGLSKEKALSRQPSLTVVAEANRVIPIWKEKFNYFGYPDIKVSE